MPENIQYTDNINASKVSSKLTRDQWEKLYKEGKAQLVEIPREYQSYIKANNFNYRPKSKYTTDWTATANNVKTGIQEVATSTANWIKENPEVVAEMAIDQVPIVGDVKGLTYDVARDWKNEGWKSGLTTAGIGLLTLVPFTDSLKSAYRLKKYAKLTADQKSLLDDIVTSTKETGFLEGMSDRWMGRKWRSRMKGVQSDKEIINNLSNKELGQLIKSRNRLIEQGLPDSRWAISDNNARRIDDIVLMDNSGKIGRITLDPRKTEDSIPVETIANLTEDLPNRVKGVSEDLYNAALIATNRPIRSGRVLNMPERTTRVTSKFKSHIFGPGSHNYKPMDILNDDDLLKRYMDDYSLFDENTASYHIITTRDPKERITLTGNEIVLEEPTRFIPTKNRYLFDINSNTITGGKVRVNWDNPSLYQKKGGKIRIKPENRGKFTASAQRAGMGVQEYARHVLANKDKYSSTLVKRANFARNSKKFKHLFGGTLPTILKLGGK